MAVTESYPLGQYGFRITIAELVRGKPTGNEQSFDVKATDLERDCILFMENEDGEPVLNIVTKAKR